MLLKTICFRHIVKSARCSRIWNLHIRRVICHSFSLHVQATSGAPLPGVAILYGVTPSYASQAFGRTQCRPSSHCQHPAIPHKPCICLEGSRSPFSGRKAGIPGAKHRSLQRVATDPIRGNAEEDEATVREPASSPSPCSTSEQQVTLSRRFIMAKTKFSCAFNDAKALL